MFTISASISRILEPSPQGLISSATTYVTWHPLPIAACAQKVLISTGVCNELIIGSTEVRVKRPFYK